MKIFYTDTFQFPLPDNHRFPVEKYTLLRQQLQGFALKAGLEFLVPEGATDEQLALVHSEAYLRGVLDGTLDQRQIRRIGLPWSAELVERSRRSVGGTIAASQEALREGVAMSLAGGTHHAFADHGEGFCVFNDVAVAVALLQSKGLVQQLAIVDADVHQGNGTASLFDQDPSVFTLSIHGEKNFPFRKFPGDLDIGLPDGTGDEVYLDEFRQAVEIALSRVESNLVFYLAGADPHKNDRMGRLALTGQGLARRDQILFDCCLERQLPLAIVLAGGYGRDISETVQMHMQTVILAAQHHQNWIRMKEDRAMRP